MAKTSQTFNVNGSHQEIDHGHFDFALGKFDSYQKSAYLISSLSLEFPGHAAGSR